jgi:hypothetical protein
MGNPWLVHVKKTMKNFPKLQFKQVLKQAKKTWKKGTAALVPKKNTQKRKTGKRKTGKRKTGKRR